MHGNIWECCQETWHEDYNGAPSDGSPWVSENENDYRMLRGGSSVNDPGYCRSAFRHGCVRDIKYPYVGFRVVVALVSDLLCQNWWMGIHRAYQRRVQTYSSEVV